MPLQDLFGRATVFHLVGRTTVFHFSWNQHSWEELWFHEKWNTVCALCLSNTSLATQLCSTFHETNMPAKGFGSMTSGTKFAHKLSPTPVWAHNCVPLFMEPTCLGKAAVPQKMENSLRRMPLQRSWRTAVFHCLVCAQALSHTAERSSMFHLPRSVPM